MKRILVVILTGLLCLSTFSMFLPRVKGSGDSYEPDNSFTQYSSMTVTTSLQSQSRSIEPAGDNDYIRFQASPGTYTFYTSSSIDTYGYLYDSGQAELTHDDDSGGNVQFRIQYAISSAGYYFLRVRGYTSSIHGSYTLYYSYQPQAIGSDFDHAQSIYGLTSGSLSQGQRYYYLLPPIELKSLLTVLLSGPGSGDFDVELYSPSRVFVARAATSSSDDALQIISEQAGNYYAVVLAYSGSGSYTLNFDTYNIYGDGQFTDFRSVGMSRLTSEVFVSASTAVTHDGAYGTAYFTVTYKKLNGAWYPDKGLLITWGINDEQLQDYLDALQQYNDGESSTITLPGNVVIAWCDDIESWHWSTVFDSDDLMSAIETYQELTRNLLEFYQAVQQAQEYIESMQAVFQAGLDRILGSVQVSQVMSYLNLGLQAALTGMSQFLIQYGTEIISLAVTTGFIYALVFLI